MARDLKKMVKNSWLWSEIIWYNALWRHLSTTLKIVSPATIGAMNFKFDTCVLWDITKFFIKNQNFDGVLIDHTFFGPDNLFYFYSFWCKCGNFDQLLGLIVQWLVQRLDKLSVSGQVIAVQNEIRMEWFNTTTLFWPPVTTCKCLCLISRKIVILFFWNFEHLFFFSGRNISWKFKTLMIVTTP